MDVEEIRMIHYCLDITAQYLPKIAPALVQKLTIHKQMLITRIIAY